jgi:hypothetical protein
MAPSSQESEPPGNPARFNIEAALRFLFNAMAPKPEEDGSPFQGIPGSWPILMIMRRAGSGG